MLYDIMPPPEELRVFVRHYWFIERPAGQNGQVPFTLMAEGFPNLIFQYNSTFEVAGKNGIFYPPVILHGHSCNTHDVLAHPGFGVCGIAFYPFAIPYFFGVNAQEVTNDLIDGACLLGGQGSEMYGRVVEASSVRERATLFTGFLMQKLANVKDRDSAIEHAVHQIVRHRGTQDIAALSKDMGLSRRQLERRFSGSVGFSPKQYSRIVRFQSALWHPSASITDVAYSFGYADQAHFIREFREFSGMSPKHYFKGKREAAENFVERS